MKQMILLLALSSILFSCKKESGASHPKQILLTEIKRKGLIANRIEYNSDNLVIKLEGYSDEVTNNTMQLYVVFDYNGDKQITQYRTYGMPGNIPAQKVLITYDSTGKLVSTVSYDMGGPTPNLPEHTSTFYYNAKGLVSKSVSKNAAGENAGQTNYSYYDDGNLKERQSWRAEEGVLWLSSRYSYTMPNGYIPNGMEQIIVLTGAEFFATMNSDAINFKFYDQNGFIHREYNEVMSFREYNDDGSLRQQVVTKQKVKPDGDDESEIFEYKYITQ